MYDGLARIIEAIDNILLFINDAFQNNRIGVIDNTRSKMVSNITAE